MDPWKHSQVGKVKVVVKIVTSTGRCVGTKVMYVLPTVVAFLEKGRCSYV